MTKKSTHSLGALHPFIFFVIIYGISLFLAFFVCSTVYYSINGNEGAKEPQSLSQQQFASTNAATATAFR